MEIDEITVPVTGYYWNFPEVLYTWGKGLRYARLVKIEGQGFQVYMRAQKTQATVACWVGEPNLEEFQDKCRSLGLRRIKFLPQDEGVDLGIAGGYRSAVWYSRSSWSSDESLSKNRRWQFRRAVSRYELVPVAKDGSDEQEALNILQSWLQRAQQRQMIMGVGHYASCIRLHPELETSHLFFIRPRDSSRNVGLVGGFVRDDKAVVVNVKHDWSDKWLIHAAWGLWMEYVHSDLGVPFSCNGSTSDNIKKRMHMERRMYYKPPKMILAGEVLEDARLVSSQ